MYPAVALVGPRQSGKTTLARSFEGDYFDLEQRYEIDLVIERPAERWAIEVKLTTSPGLGDLARLAQSADLIHAHRRFLISQTPKIVEGKHAVSCNLPWFLEQLS